MELPQARIAEPDTLPLTGERTVPELEQENYWFRRHEVAYDWLRRNPGEWAMPRTASAPVTGVPAPARLARLARPAVLEAGAGEGYGAALLVEAGYDVIACELDDAAVRHLHRRYPRVSAVQANLAAPVEPDGRFGGLPIRPASLDAVVSMQVIEHLWDLPGFLRECARVVRPGGSVVLSTPNRLTFSPGLGRGERPVNPFHVEEFDAEQLGSLVGSVVGMHDVRVLGVHAGPRLAADDAELGDLVAAQVGAVLAEADDGTPWPDALLGRVREVSTDDFEIDGDPARVDAALDLVVVARVR